MDRQTPRISPIPIICLLCAVWILPGLTGHEPWAPGEPTYVGVAYDLATRGDWIVPKLADEPFMEKPPLMYVSSALLGSTLSKWLPFHDGARLATGFYMALTAIFVGLTARELYGGGHGWKAVAILIGCLGLPIRMHQLLPDVSLLTGFAIGLFGFALSSRRPLWAGVVLGIGTGVGFLSKGLLAPGVFGVTALVLPFFKTWRRRAYVLCLAVAALTALPWLAVWPYALYQRAPQLFMTWLWDNNIGRFFGLNNRGPKDPPLYYFKLLPWFAFPAWPLAAWTVWRRRLAGTDPSGIQLPLTFFLVLLTVLRAASDGCELYAMPMLLPLAVLAAPSVDALGRNAARVLQRVTVAVVAVSGGLLWVGWLAVVTGHAPTITAWANTEVPAQMAGVSNLAVVLSLMFTVVWLPLAWLMDVPGQRWLITWTGGVSLVWLLLMVLWSPVGDAAKGYGPMVTSFRQSLPRYRCIASRAMGEHDRAMWDYYAGIVTQRVEVTKPDCDLFLVGDAADKPESAPGPEWRAIWEGHRWGEPTQYRLYQRMDLTTSADER
jgi:4-amino-4-deoxy-L-arabinose transferase-like glycosyltransferase